MLRALKRLLGRDPQQLEMRLGAGGPPRDAAGLLAALRGMGLRSIRYCRLTANRNVMVSFGGGELRVHEGYLDAPPEVLRAVVVFVEGRTRAERREAQRAIVGYPIRTPKPPVRRDRTRPEDQPLADQLTEWHRRYNERHFGGRLRPATIRVSRRMRSRLGHYTAATPGGEPAEIAISFAHLRKHGWDEVLHTLLHEMVHQWQDEVGHTIDHGATFRAKAREVGIAPLARRALAARVPGRMTGSHTVGRRAARHE
ncbi:MAG: SprT-like domain-containing protein [Gemmatimonadota bacterium]|nr:SprT-like domain-containing protein [Gemmatimonadota bacterium]